MVLKGGPDASKLLCTAWCPDLRERARHLDMLAFGRLEVPGVFNATTKKVEQRQHLKDSQGWDGPKLVTHSNGCHQFQDRQEDQTEVKTVLVGYDV